MFRDGVTARSLAWLSVIILVLVSASGYGAYKLWDYKENNPNFCMGCHLMKTAFDKWSISEHKGINCHQCHHLSLMEQNKLLVSLVLHDPKTIPSAHGKVLVPWKYCVKCHWETDPMYPNARNVSDSPIHARHFFQQKLQCSDCHGYRLHEFTVEPRFCVRCHPKNAKVHGMEDFACLACHTDESSNLLPTRNKCLTCHGNAEQRAMIASMPKTVDTRHFHPSKDEIAIASSLTTFPDDGPMRFNCYQCHKPHSQLMPVVEKDCMACHSTVPHTGKHALHLGMGLKCLDCHKPHTWKVTKAMGRSAKCTKCHGPVNPADFLL